MRDRRASLFWLPIDVITKQFDCCTARRSSGSIVVILVALPNGPHQSALRPSSTAIVPSGDVQRCSCESAPALAPPAAAPVTPAFCPPGVTTPPQPATDAPSAATSAP
ncbi:hypothetical protein IST4112_06523 [Burkholderia cenocepacia]|nr:hypothetical protein IST4112_06523 [Burkholderia cenocepacia]